MLLIKELFAAIIGAMVNPTLPHSPSSSVGDYLKAIWELSGTGAAATKDVADRLSVAAASVTNMFARLQDMDLVQYKRYHGASLTEAGRAEAIRLVRRHRLIETFLLECLGYSWEEVHEEAERLEHVVSDEFTERLADLLDHPAHDPHGDPIPAADGTLEPDDSSRLSEAKAGDQVRILRVGNEDVSALAYLGKRGLVPGRSLEVKEVRAVDGVATVEDEDGTSHSLGAPLADSLFVRGLSAGND
jgi:DtxR family Mn-dependent transcriptional regulator